MTDLTISVPDELMEKLRPHLDELPRVLELGVKQMGQADSTKTLSDRERIFRLLAAKGIAHPLDKNLLPASVLDHPRQKPLAILGKPVSEIVVEQRGPQ